MPIGGLGRLGVVLPWVGRSGGRRGFVFGGDGAGSPRRGWVRGAATARLPPRGARPVAPLSGIPSPARRRAAASAPAWHRAVAHLTGVASMLLPSSSRRPQPPDTMTKPLLFTPLRIRDVTLQEPRR